MVQNKQKKQKILWGRVIDCLLLVVYPAISIYLLLMINTFTDKYTLIAGVVLFIIYAGYILTFFTKNNSKIEVIRKVIMIIICGCLLFSSSLVKGISDGIGNLSSTDTQEKVVVNIDVLVLKDRDTPIKNLDELGNYTIGFQTGDQSKSITQAEEEVQKVIGNDYARYEYNDYSTIFHDYYNGYVDAIVINQDQKNYLTEEYASLYKDSTVLKTYTYTYATNIEGNNIDVTKEKFTVYVSASDETDAPASNSLSDMNMLMIIDPTTNHITTISIPRDSYIPNPALDNYSDKLTHTGNDGVTNTVAAVEQALQVEIDFYVKISFSSLIEIVDTLGGIDVNVLISFTEQDENRSFNPEDMITLQAGEQHLDGRQALAYARHRSSYLDQDLGRNQAQVEVMKGIIKRLMTVDGINKIDNVLDLLPSYTIMNFSNSQITSFVKQQVDDMKGWSISSIQLNNGKSSLATTASTGNQELSIYYLSKSDLLKLSGVYNIIENEQSLSEITFDLNHLFEDYSTYEDNGLIELVY